MEKTAFYQNEGEVGVTNIFNRTLTELRQSDRQMDRQLQVDRILK